MDQIPAECAPFLNYGGFILSSTQDLFLLALHKGWLCLEPCIPTCPSPFCRDIVQQLHFLLIIIFGCFKSAFATKTSHSVCWTHNHISQSPYRKKRVIMNGFTAHNPTSLFAGTAEGKNQQKPAAWNVLSGDDTACRARTLRFCELLLIHSQLHHLQKEPWLPFLCYGRDFSISACLTPLLPVSRTLSEKALWVSQGHSSISINKFLCISIKFYKFCSKV